MANEQEGPRACPKMRYAGGLAAGEEELEVDTLPVVATTIAAAVAGVVDGVADGTTVTVALVVAIGAPGIPALDLWTQPHTHHWRIKTVLCV